MKQYVTDNLNKIADSEGFTGYRIDVSSGSEHGDGFMSTMVRATIVGEKKSAAGTVASLSLILKMVPDNEARREQFNSVMSFEREVYVYNHVFPILLEFQRSKGVSEADGFFSIPKCYVAFSDTAKDEHLIVMEDLRTSGYELWDKQKPATYESIKLVFEEIAKYHGLSMALRDQQPERFAEARPTGEDIIVRILKTEGIKAVFLATFDSVLALVDSKSVVADKMIYFRDNFTDLMKSFFLPEATEPFGVLLHGDLKMNNLMFLANGDKLNKICLIDWQVVTFASPVLDLSYLIFSSTDKAFRDKYLDELLDIYHSTVTNTLNRLGSDAQTIFTVDNFQDELRKNAAYAVVMVPMMLQILLTNPNNIVDFDEFSENTTTEKPQALTTLVGDENRQYAQMVTEAIEDAIRLKWL